MTQKLIQFVSAQNFLCAVFSDIELPLINDAAFQKFLGKLSFCLKGKKEEVFEASEFFVPCFLIYTITVTRFIYILKNKTYVIIGHKCFALYVIFLGGSDSISNMKIVTSVEPNRKSFDTFPDPVNVERARNKMGCVTPLNSTYSLFKDDTKVLAPKQHILGQVLDGFLLTLSSYSFKYNNWVYMLPETFFSYVNKDIFLETTIPYNCKDTDFIVALSYFNSHWSLVMIDCTQRHIYYFDP